MEALNNVKYVVFDKTGTLTKGAFKVTSINPAAELSEDELLEYAAFAELHSTHPIAESIKVAYGKEIKEDQLDGYNEISGHGIQVNVQGKEVLAGNIKLMNKYGIEAPNESGTVIHVAIEKKYAGFIIISDEIKDDSAKAVRSLKELGIKKIVMLTGDAKAVGDSVGKQLGIDEVHAELLPQHKVEEIEKLMQSKSPKEK